MNNTEEPNQLVKNKRDQYLIDIRKNKNEQLIRTKRRKLIQSSPDEEQTIKNEVPSSQGSFDVQEYFNNIAVSFCNALKDQDVATLNEVAESVRRAISLDDDPPIQQLMNTGIVEYIVKLLDPEYYGEVKLMIECSWIVANIASAYQATEIYQYLMKFDILPRAVNLFGYHNADVQENAVWIVANIAGETLEFRDFLLESGIVEKMECLVPSLKNYTALATQVAWLISNLVRGKPYPNFEKISPLLKYIQYFLDSFDNNLDDKQTISYALWSLTHISDGDLKQIEELYNVNFCKKLVEIVQHKDLDLKAPALRTIGNMLTASDTMTQPFIDVGLIPALVPLLHHKNRQMRKETAWVFSNIMGGKDTYLEDVMRFQGGELIKRLFFMIDEDDAIVAKECTLCLTNACLTGTFEQVKELVDQGMVKTLVETIRENTSVSLLKPCLEALEAVFVEYEKFEEIFGVEANPIWDVLEQCNGFEVIEKLQFHSDESVYTLVAKIIDDYFETDNIERP